LPDRNNYYIASSRIQLIPKMRANLSISIELQLLQHLERRAANHAPHRDRTGQF